MEFGIVRAFLVLGIFLMPGILLLGASLFLVFGRQDRKTRFLKDDKWTLVGVVCFYVGMFFSVGGFFTALLVIFIILWNVGTP